MISRSIDIVKSVVTMRLKIGFSGIHKISSVLSTIKLLKLDKVSRKNKITVISVFTKIKFNDIVYNYG